MNPPNQYIGIHHGHQITLTETGKNTAIDDDGNTWFFDKIWEMNYIHKRKIVDSVKSNGFDRNNSGFNTYKKSQELLAEQKLNQIMNDKPIQNDLFYSPKAYDSHFEKQSDDLKLKNDIMKERLRALEIFAKLFDVQNNH
jgi:hypothetical protein